MTRLGNLPRWQQVGIFIAVMALLIPAADYGQSIAKSILFGSESARRVKKQLEPLADKLDDARKIGDKAAAFALLEPAQKIVQDFNDLDDAKKAEINETELRYCVLASTNLLDGVIEIVRQGTWSAKTQYENAIGKCR